MDETNKSSGARRESCMSHEQHESCMSDDEHKSSMSDEQLNRPPEQSSSIDVIPDGLEGQPPEMIMKQLNDMDGFDR